MALKGTRTEKNLRAAFAAEAQTNRRYLYFAQQADIEGQSDAAELFRTAAEAETGHAFGHLEFLETCGDPLTGKELGTTKLNLEAALMQEKDEAEKHYPEMARIARADKRARTGFPPRRPRRGTRRAPTDQPVTCR